MPVDSPYLNFTWSAHTESFSKEMLESMWEKMKPILTEAKPINPPIEYSKADAEATLKIMSGDYSDIETKALSYLNGEHPDPPKTEAPAHLVHAVVTFYDAEEEEVIYDLKCPLPCRMRPDDTCDASLEWDAVGSDMFRTTQWSQEYGYTHTDLSLGVHYFTMEYVGYGEDAEADIEWLTEAQMQERARG
jgi:hypothetical protein